MLEDEKEITCAWCQETSNPKEVQFVRTEEGEWLCECCYEDYEEGRRN